ncbi:uncharacterized protein LOC113340950 [Papaver somniferum]|uniref:uncharacterized protein LOC113340950 n=1 Tax=Papaver somniferum TaxID=3469 RepID=UPI000E6F5050|nr:uncharacterized protein LOC113340950 [Papaver somniferum]
MHPDERANSTGSSSKNPHIVQMIHDTGLCDLGFHGSPYTWTSGKNGTGRIKSRSAAFRLDKELNTTRRDLSKWNKEHFGNIHDIVKRLQDELTSLKQLPTSADTTSQIRKVENDINEWYAREEEFYRQQSRDLMFHEIDQNTKYFHQQTNRRKLRNRIESLLKPNGSWCSGMDNLE